MPQTGSVAVAGAPAGVAASSSPASSAARDPALASDTISAMMLTATSSGRTAPMSRPAGPRTPAIRLPQTPRDVRYSRTRAMRFGDTTTPR